MTEMQAGTIQAGVGVQLPQYQCHKKVRALKIAAIVRDGEDDPTRDTGESAIFRPAEEGYGPIYLSAEFMRKHKPEVGGYYVVYDDGYKSFSPAKAFEEGYTKI